MKRPVLTTLMLVVMIAMLFALGDAAHSRTVGSKIIEAYESPSVDVAPSKISAPFVTMVFVNPGDAQQTAQAAEKLVLLLEQETGYEVRAIVPNCMGAAVDLMATGAADFGLLPDSTPANIRALLAQCLEKEPDKRLGDITNATLEISETLTVSAMAVTTKSRKVKKHNGRNKGFKNTIL